MDSLSSYQIIEPLYESTNSRVYRGQREEDNLPVVIKVLQTEYPSPQQLTHLQNEYEFTKDLNITGIRKALELTEIDHKPALLLEYVAGKTLKQSFLEQDRSLVDFLEVAIQIAQTLGEIHQHSIIHKDINAHNILFEAETQQVKIIDFGISSQMCLKCYHLGHPSRLEGTLSYLSPEQTGRMNRLVDYRSDLYSLGITFYEMLTGQLPFRSDDPLELVHAHLAKVPRPLHQLRPEIPEMLSRIVMKLLAKNAEDRYQSASGLKYDLERCLEIIQTSNGQGRVSDLIFALGQRDFSGRFQIPQKLYGRDREIEILLGAFEGVTQPSSAGEADGSRENSTVNGSPNIEIMWVTGEAGVGKSALIHEVHKPITEKRGYFIQGKFDQFQRNIPYYAWTHAFRGWVNLLLTEDEASLKSWRDKILEAVGELGQVLLELIPNLELIIGPQAPVPELGGLEAQNRFNYLFQKFIKVIARPEHPLVIFIDDWQWADSASLNLLKTLAGDPTLRSLLLIGAYRDNEVSPTHPFTLTLEEVRQEQPRIKTIHLQNLHLAHVQDFLSDALTSGSKPLPQVSLQELSHLVYEKTLGNAFFVGEFLKSLYAEGALYFDFTSAAWAYDVATIKALNMTDNVVELLAGKVLKLSHATQNYLKLAACIGNEFDEALLQVIAGAGPQEIKANLARALEEGLIYSDLSGLYRFSHDRIQQAAYSLIPSQGKQQVHLRIGRLLLENIPLDRREERIFEIVNQLNLGLGLLDHQNDKTQLAELNLMAGKKAKVATAYAPAFNYLQAGLSLLAADSWQTDYLLSLTLYTEAAEMAYLSGNFEAMEQLTEVVLQRADNILDKVKAYQVRIVAKAGQNQGPEAIGAALDCVEQLLGWTLPRTPTQADVQQRLQQTMANLAGQQIEALADLPPMTDPHAQAAMTILSHVGAVAYRTDMRLTLLMSLEMINLSLAYGNTTTSPYAYASYGFVLCSVVQDIDSGYRFGELALALIDRLQAKAHHARTLMVIHPLIKHWREAASASLPSLLAMYPMGLESGDIQAAAVGIGYYASYAYFAGTRLAELRRKVEPYREPLRKFKQTTSLNKVNLYLQAALNLMHESDEPSHLLGPVYHEEEMLAHHLAIKDTTTLFHQHLTKMSLSFLFEDYEQAQASASNAAPYLAAVTGQLLVPIFYFYHDLTQLRRYPAASQAEQEEILARVDEHQRQMEKWAKQTPANHLHKFYLVEAERHRLLEQPKEAREYYDLALQAATRAQYINEEALIAEMAGKFYLNRGDTFLAETYLRRAYQAYWRWGAAAKASQLDMNYPHLVHSVLIPTGLSTTVSTTSSGETTSQFLDIHTILKASQTMAGEVDLSQLLAKMIKIVAENAGAEEGFLLLEKDRNWAIEAEYHVQDQRVNVLQSIPLAQVGSGSDNPQIPSEIIHYVITTKEAIVLNHAAVEGQFTHLPYLKKKGSKSVLCLPLLHQSKLAGVLYLENNLTAGAFSPERVELLNLLTSQMAISIENARLYTDLQQSEKKYRTIFEDSRDMIFITTPSGGIIDINPACLELFGYTRDEMLQINVHEVYARAEDRLKFRQAIERYGAVKDMELRFRRRDGREFDGLLTGTLWKSEDGTVLGYQGIIRDVTAQKQAEQERLRLSAVERELILAKSIQQSLLPPPKPGWPELEVVCYSMPAREVGGDLYAYFASVPCPVAEGYAEEKRYALAVGDVTSKGMPAALLMAVSLASLGSTVRQGLPPQQLLAQLDTALVDYTRESKQNCALVYVEITLSEPAGEEAGDDLIVRNPTVSLRMANAGCPAPLLKRNDGSIAWVEIGGIPLGLGLGAETGYQEVGLTLAAGEFIILTSDGVLEAMNAKGEIFGFERLEAAVASGPSHSAEALLDHLKAKVAAFVGTTEPHDDLTIVVVRV